jgi:5-methyltetrahydrofolate--homocysteine methyltransferase
MNCGAGPEDMVPLLERMGPRLEVPVHVQPNAGLPELEGNKTVFRLQPEPFADQTAALVNLGAKFLGGCCGTGPDHIAALGKALGGTAWQRPAPNPPGIVLTTRSHSVYIGPGNPLAIIGERINPTGKQQLTEELQQGVMTEVLAMAEDQIALGASVLDVNVGAPMVDEKVLLPQAAQALAERVSAPLALDSNDADALEAALWTMPGSALANSISGEPDRMERLGPVVRDLGCPFILLPIIGRKLPVTAAERLDVIEKLLAQAEALGIPKRLIMVDALALTVSSKPEAAKACLDVIRHCTDVWGLPTTMGLSNISFGLPARELVNGTFLAMAMAAGMSSAISHPGSTRLREAQAAAEVLLTLDPGAERFISDYADWTPGSGESGGGAPGAGGRPARKKAETPGEAVIMGAKDDVEALVQAELDQGVAPFAIVNEQLIPGIMEVGEKYERKEYFLPQLMLSAEAMQRGFAVLKPLLAEEEGAAAKPKIIMATVEGDIHDIGKNIVCLLLKNHGFDVLDLGKDVPAQAIVDAARKEGAPLIGLSALMTTTMVRMEDVVRLAKKHDLDSRIIIGGAVVSQAYAERIGADGYATDAVAAVRLAKQLLEA